MNYQTNLYSAGVFLYIYNKDAILYSFYLKENQLVFHTKI
jgi:uncharacterized protein YbcV (DUF1398 family)